MAPEQARGKIVRRRAARRHLRFGAIFYELLTGRPPFRAETAAETLRQVISQEPVAPSRLNAAVPRRRGNRLPAVPGEGPTTALRQRRGLRGRSPSVPGATSRLWRAAWGHWNARCAGLLQSDGGSTGGYGPGFDRRGQRRRGLVRAGAGRARDRVARRSRHGRGSGRGFPQTAPLSGSTRSVEPGLGAVAAGRPGRTRAGKPNRRGPIWI